MLMSLNTILFPLICVLLSALAFAKDGPGTCGPAQPTPTGWPPPIKLHVAASDGTAPYGTLFGIQVAARKTCLGGTGGSCETTGNCASGAEKVAVVAVTSFDTGKIEIFFLDPETGAIKDGQAIGSGAITQAHIRLPMPPFTPGATGMKMGDINNDCLPDIVLNLRGQGKSAVFVAQLSGGVLTYPGPPYDLVPSSAPLGTYPYSFALGNLLGDDADEIAVTERGAASGKNVMPDKIHLFQWLTGSFVNIRTIVAPPGSGVIASLAMGDVIGNTAPDLVMGDPHADVNGTRDAGQVYVYDGNLSAFLNPPISPRVRDQMFGVEVGVGRIRGGTYSDLVGASSTTSAYVYPGPVDSPPSPVVLSAGQANKMAMGDVNGDLLHDFVIGDPFSCNGAGAAYIFLGAPDPLPLPRYTLGPPEIIGPTSGIGFGFRVQAVNGTRLLIISAKAIPVGTNGSGQVHVYQVTDP